MSAVLELDDVTVGYRRADGGWTDAVRGASLVLERGRTYGLVGESGSGKSTLALAALRYLPANGAVRAGTVRVDGDDLYALGDAELRRVWRERVALVPQNPLPSLNPSHTLGRQIVEVITAAGGASPRQRARDLFADVGLPDPDRTLGSYPHQISGGQQQRVMIAMALAAEPALLVLDEPTTNLDVTTEAAILDLIADLVAARDTAVLYVSHSLGVVAQVSDRVAVLYAGDVVEDAPADALYAQPLHPYTRGLLDSVPRIGQARSEVALRPIPGRIPPLDDRPEGCLFAPRCPLAIAACRGDHPPLEEADDGRRTRCIRWQGIAEGSLDPRQPGAAAAPAPDTAAAEAVLELRDLRVAFAVTRDLGEVLRGRPPQQVRALDGVDLDVPRRATVGLVGESGSGKSTLARAVIGLNAPSGGSIELLDVPLAPTLAGRDRRAIERLQMVFQSSEEALNPYRTVGQTLRRPFERLAGLSRAEAEARVGELLERVKLSPDYAARRPDQLSGGERQRVAIARAFASQPDLLLFDESVSGLDVSVQAAILNLLSDLQRERDSAYLFISHDLSVVAYLADVVAVIYLGALMEVGPTRAVLEPPYHPYTEALLSAVPLIDPSARRATIRLEGDVPSPVDVPSGCRFHTRCPRFLGDVCVEETPPWREREGGSRIACHIPLDELDAQQEPVFARFSASGRSERRAQAPADPADPTDATDATDATERGEDGALRG